MFDTPRKISARTILSSLKKRPISILLGSIFVFFTIFFAAILAIVFSFVDVRGPEVDYDLINSQGRDGVAIITDIETQYNVTVNGVHPSTISYRYPSDGEQIVSKYKVLEERKVSQLRVGDELAIKTLNGDSIIVGMKPFAFPTWIFALVLLPILAIGLLALAYSLFHLFRELKLYKYGRLAWGEIVSMIPKSGFPVFGFGQGVIVHYEYEAENLEKILGESLTADLSIVNDYKKGDQIPIFVSTDNKNRSCVISKLDAVRNGWDIDL